MMRIWQFIPMLPLDQPGMDSLGQCCRFKNHDEMVGAKLVDHEFAPDDFPIARLELTIESFSLDCFFWGLYVLVSQDMRDAMALGPEDVQYLPVDASLSAPLPRSKNYMIMHVPVVENVSDPDQSDYEYLNISGLPKNLLSPSRIAIRHDFAPEHEAFHDSFFRGLFCTDKFALRVLNRQCTGMRFDDPWYHDRRPRFRSLRGIEELIGHPLYEVTHTRLVQAIP